MHGARAAMHAYCFGLVINITTAIIRVQYKCMLLISYNSNMKINPMRQMAENIIIDFNRQKCVSIKVLSFAYTHLSYLFRFIVRLNLCELFDHKVVIYVHQPYTIVVDE